MPPDKEEMDTACADGEQGCDFHKSVEFSDSVFLHFLVDNQQPQASQSHEKAVEKIFVLLPIFAEIFCDLMMGCVGKKHPEESQEEHDCSDDG